MSRPRVLVLAWIGSTNLGDELVAEEVCGLVHEAGGDPTVVTVDETVSARLGAPMVRHSGGRDALALARALREHDAAVFGGGGLVQDETGPLNLPFHLSRLATARLLRRPWAGLGLGVGSVRRRTGRGLVRATMRGAVAISVRDRGSADRYLDLTGTRPLVAADPVFGRTVGRADVSDHLVVSLRRANQPGQRRLSTTTPPHASRVRRWAEIIDAVAVPRGLAVRFVAWECVQDGALHRAVASRLHSPTVIEAPSADHIVDRMGAGRLVLTMRYHGAIAALLHGRPTVVVDYSPKMADLVAESGGGMELAPVGADPGTVIGLFDQVIDRDGERTRARTDLVRRAAINRIVVDRLVHEAHRRSSHDQK